MVNGMDVEWFVVRAKRHQQRAALSRCGWSPRTLRCSRRRGGKALDGCMQDRTMVPITALNLRRFRDHQEVHILPTSGLDDTFVTLSYLWGTSKPL